MYADEDDGFSSQNVWPGLGTTQQLSPADGLVAAASLWFLSLTNVTARRGHGNPLSDQSASIHTITHDYFQPYTSSFCAPDTIEGKSDNRPLIFPTLLGANDISQSDTTIEYRGFKGLESVPAITMPGTSRSLVLDTPGLVSNYRLRWIELNGSQFNGSAIGAVMLLPNSADNQSQPILSCNLAAGWGLSRLSTQVPGMVTSSTAVFPGKKYAYIPIESSNVPAKEINDAVIFQYPYFPQIPINITQSWADLVAPRFKNSNDSIINQLMQDQMIEGDPKSYAHFVLSDLVANGLARTALSSELQGSVKTVIGKSGDIELDGNYWLSGKGDVFAVNASQANDWIKFRMDSTLEGHAYNTKGAPQKIAIAILTAYCVLALSHALYAGISGKCCRSSLQHLLPSLSRSTHNLQNYQLFRKLKH